MIIPGFTSRLHPVKKKTGCKGLIRISHLSRGVTIRQRAWLLARARTLAHICTHSTSAQTVPQCLQTSVLQMAGSLTPDDDEAPPDRRAQDHRPAAPSRVT